VKFGVNAQLCILEIYASFVILSTTLEIFRWHPVFKWPCFYWAKLSANVQINGIVSSPKRYVAFYLNQHNQPKCQAHIEHKRPKIIF
jgi:hypothetical protein